MWQPGACRVCAAVQPTVRCFPTMMVTTPLSGKITPRLGWWTWSVAVLPVRGTSREQCRGLTCAQICLKIDEWDTMADDYWGYTMDVAAILDKK